ncbi:origin recognition complex subunit 2 [Coccomyxa subellipsoidea C-169]|uniref:Origin recognition complex subunit 2 n=1 Tax=Coccomyxa subellipsoidea (strain C-169) TaxID=574566 RepID=I0YP23_COCSC|nr:origin recognition complex subunit 2 [Coccomyxa subellipsoidea C-169]EIE20142.1 origin recognition complex subunit 2 [Coccomyxa subellipsoidea C-169]|eukprot:XP_005644686.1 origin recognition complex subunit 2 [Coccomyxa subellipsoidea C-169]
MTSYFSSKGPARASAKRGCSSLADLSLDLNDEDARSQLQNLPVKNKEAKQALFAKYVRDFPKWLLPLREGYSLLFYGLGSKRALLEKFAQKELLDGGVVVFNGFRPTLKLREILSTVAAHMTDCERRGGDNHAILEQIRSAPADGGILYIVLHNIDGPGLRGRETQEMLSELSRCPAIRLVASVDHVNSCLLWDKRTAAQFNWLHFDVTTYAPYTVEAREMPSLLIGRRETVRSSNAATVLRTLVPQARAIFRLLAEHQMEDRDEGEEEGQSTLFRMSRERLLVANDAALRGHLTEFKDHDLLQTRRGQDGSDLLVIPIEAQTLLQVLEDVDAPT